MDTYQRAHVTVDDNFARFGSKSYAINKITSVDVRMHETRKSAWLFFGIVGVVMLLAGLGSLGAPGKEPAAMFIGIAVVCAFISVSGYRNRLTRKYELMLATAAGEVQATTATDPDAIQELRQAIESRMAALS